MADHEAWQLAEFVRSHTALSARTLSAYESDVRLFADWAQRGNVESPPQVNRRLVRRYVASLSTREYARRSIARKAAALRRYFGWALATGLVSVDPTLGLHVTSDSGRLPRVLDRRDIDTLLDGPTPDA